MTLTLTQQWVLDRARKLAQKVKPVAGAKVAAIIRTPYGREFVGVNSRKTHPLQAKFGKNDKAICKHAEVDAIVTALRWIDTDDLRGSIIYVARAKADGSDGMAKPCEGCQKALIAFDFADCIWTE